jgi:NADPH-dependent 2,4-dienoyl-CoA reductase/sulfur reductase-like enzyme
MRFLLEVVKEIRKKTGKDYPLSVRLSGTEYEPDGIMIDDTIQVAKELEKLGVNAIHVSGGNYHQRVQRTSTMALPLGLMIWAAEAVKKEVNIPVIASNSIHTPELAESVLEKGQADFVSLGRPLLADPYWPQKARQGRPDDIAPCIRCNDGCFYRGMAQFSGMRCTVNVTLGREDELRITRARLAKKVAIIGGGPAGMEAARVCALSGHDVTLYEKHRLGGALLEASVPEFKSDLKRLIKYFTTQMSNLRIKVIYENATLSNVRDGDYAAEVVAVGGVPIQLDVPGADKPIVTSAQEVLYGRAMVGQRVIIVGGGLIGTETGLFLAEQGKEIIFVEVLDEFMNGVLSLDRIVYQERLAKQKITIHSGNRIESVNDNGAVIVDGYGKRKEIFADSIVVAIGLAPQRELEEELRKVARLKVFTAGDCVRPRKIFDAIHEGYLAAYTLMHD